jgi:hypothetical protein
MAMIGWHVVAVLLALAVTACSESEDAAYERYRKELRRLHDDEAKPRYLDLGQAALNQGCLHQGKTELRGEATQRDIDELVANVRLDWPDGPIYEIHVSDRVALVAVGRGCGVLLGSGEDIYFERSGSEIRSRWQRTLVHNWVG